MAGPQLDLFAGSGNRSEQTATPIAARKRPIASELDDGALIVAIPHASRRMPQSHDGSREAAAGGGCSCPGGALPTLPRLRA